MDKEGIFVLSKEEIEFLEFMAEVSRAVAALPKPAIYPGCNDDKFSNTLSSDGVDVNCLPTESVSSESESEAHVNSELVTPILRNVENATVLVIIEPITEFRNSMSAYEPTDEALQSQQSSCTSTLEVIVSDNTAEIKSDGIETMAEIKAAEELEEPKNIQGKSFFKRLGRRLLKTGRRLCCCCCSKLD